MEENGEELFYTLQKAANYAHVTRQAIYVALRKKELKGHKVNDRWRISKNQMDEYRLNKYNVDKRKVEGEPIFSLEHGYYSVLHVAKTLSSMLGHPYNAQHVYYLIRRGEIDAQRKGGCWVITREDAIALYEKEKTRFKNERIA